MSTLKIGVHLLPLETGNAPRSGCEETVGVILDSSDAMMIEAELLDISPRLCRLRIARDRFCVDPQETRIQFAWTPIVARVIWTNTSDDFIELGLVMPSADGTC